MLKKIWIAGDDNLEVVLFQFGEEKLQFLHVSIMWVVFLKEKKNP